MLKIDKQNSFFIAKVKENQEGLLEEIKELEEYLEITDYFKSSRKEREKIVERDIIIYDGVTHPYNGIFIESIVRLNKSIRDIKTGEIKYITDYYILNSKEKAEDIYNMIISHWKIETMHQYKDVSLKEDKSKSNKHAFRLSILRSVVVNILKLHKVSNFNEVIEMCKNSLGLTLSYLSMTRIKFKFIR